MSKKISLGAGIALVAVTAAVTVSLTYNYAMSNFNSKVADVNERQAMYTKLSEIDQKTRQEFIGEIDETTLMDGICAGYVAGLSDSQAKYLSAENYKLYQNSASGKYVGVGISTMRDDDGNMEVIDVTPNSPAERSGIKKGDTIVSIDDKEVVRLTYGDAVNKLDGKAGTNIKFGILRPAEEEGGQAESLTLTVTRGEYTQQTISCLLYTSYVNVPMGVGLAPIKMYLMERLH